MNGWAKLYIVGAMLNVLAANTGCSRSPTAATTSLASEENPQALYSKYFDTSALQEVKDFHLLPPGVRDHLELA
jgi:hypothetical protein